MATKIANSDVKMYKKEIKTDSTLSIIKDDMHELVKLQLIQNSIQEIEKQLKQHKECFSWNPDQTLEDNEHANDIQELKQF